MKKTITILLTILSLSSISQSEDRKWAVGINGGTKEYYGDLGSELFTFINNHGAVGLSVNRHLNSSFDLNGAFSYGLIDFEGLKGVFETRLYDYNLLGKYKFNNGYILKKEARVAPFLIGGIGVTYSVSNHYINGNGNSFDFGFPAGVGIEFKLSDAISVELRSLVKSSWSDDWDNSMDTPFEENFGDLFVYHSVGVTYTFGKKDRDNDGIIDKLDLCPDSVGTIGAKGCPDADNDSIPDAEDECPTIAGKLKGCPDTDKDGVADKYDKCPNIFGEAKGCPDRDLDGIADIDDKCPDLIGGETGCPDLDKDGVFDNEDACPNEFGSVSAKGCPDSDKDGVADKIDLCPNEFGEKNNKGCPRVKKEEQEVLLKAMKGLFFKTGAAVVLPESYKILDDVVEVMKGNTKIEISIEGHTDNRGKQESNLILSQNRATAARDYLISKGIDKSRVFAIGYGDSRPITSNDDDKGREQNRRVEFVVLP
jgi:OOP family OmpA-OmpF porin